MSPSAIASFIKTPRLFPYLNHQLPIMSTTFQLTASDGVQLSGTSNTPTGEIKGVVVLLHGIGEHFGRYKHMADFFSTIGYATIGMDHRGHGNSGGRRGHTPSYDQLMNDIDLLMNKAKEMFPCKPIVLHGHSMGGNVAANYAIRKKPSLKGLILTGPYFRLAFNPPAWKVKLARISAGIIPTFTQPTGLEVEAISRDPKVVKDYTEDPLVHDKITSAFCVNVHPAGTYAIEHASELSMKTLAMHGTADRINSPKSTEEFANKNPQQVELKLWDGLYHEIHNEPEKQQVFDYIANWLSRI